MIAMGEAGAGGRGPDGSKVRLALWSDRCGWDDLVLPEPVDEGKAGLGLDGGWPGGWSVAWRNGREGVSCSVRELVRRPVAGGIPIRGFSWRRGQRHRP